MDKKDVLKAIRNVKKYAKNLKVKTNCMSLEKCHNDELDKFR